MFRHIFSLTTITKIHFFHENHKLNIKKHEKFNQNFIIQHQATFDTDSTFPPSISKPSQSHRKNSILPISHHHHIQKTSELREQSTIHHHYQPAEHTWLINRRQSLRENSRPARINLARAQLGLGGPRSDRRILRTVICGHLYPAKRQSIISGGGRPPAHIKSAHRRIDRKKEEASFSICVPGIRCK